MASQFQLFRTLNFCPLFMAQFLGAFNDNLMKTAVVVLVAYQIWDIGNWDPAVLVALATGLFIMPFVLFGPLAGELTDKYNKEYIFRMVKIIEIGVVTMAIISFYAQNVTFAFLILFALGAQSAFASPAKFSILPQLLPEKQLIAANGLLSTGTYVAILLGTLLGALFALSGTGIVLISALLLICALAGYGAARFIPEAPPIDRQTQIHFNPLPGFLKIINHVLRQPAGVVTAMVGVSWFYFIAGGFHSQFPNFASLTLSVDNIVLTIFLLVFSVGIGVGGMLNHRILKAEISPKLVPWAMAGVGIFAFDLCLASGGYDSAAREGNLISLGEFAADFAGWRIIADLFLLSFFAGLYIVPLRAIVQHRAVVKQKARILAGNSMLDASFLLISSLLAAALLALGLSVLDLYYILSVLCIIAAALFFKKGLF